MREGNAELHFVNLLEYVQVIHKQYAVICSTHGDPHFTQKISACVFEETREQVFHRLPAMPDELKQFACRYMEGGGSSVLEYWIQTGMKEDPSALARLILDLSNATMALAGPS